MEVSVGFGATNSNANTCISIWLLCRSVSFFSLQTERVKVLLKEPLAALNCWLRLCQQFKILAAFPPCSPANRAGCVASFFPFLPCWAASREIMDAQTSVFTMTKLKGASHTAGWHCWKKRLILQTHTHTYTDGYTLFAVCCIGGAFHRRNAATGMTGWRRSGGNPNTVDVFLFVHT